MIGSNVQAPADRNVDYLPQDKIVASIQLHLFKLKTSLLTSSLARHCFAAQEYIFNRHLYTGYIHLSASFTTSPSRCLLAAAWP